ncbi:MAG TPA: hypothetical protein VG015_10305, partial [Candidatus Dormibacteraeota bacterium]|nr:hypothetical protein [Candidatus Dormibacteraeota bacterium]
MPRGAGTAKSSATAAAAPTPVNTIMYNGGPVQVVPKVVLGFWGSAWNTDFNAYGVDSNQYMNYITNLLSNFGGGGYIGAMSAYCQNPNPPSDGSYPCSGAGAQFITNPTNQLKKVIIINDANPPTAPTDQQFQSVADQMRQNVYGANGNDPDTNYMIFTLPDHPTMVPDQTSCGAHFSYDDPSSGTAVEYTEMPFGPQDSSCNANVLNHTNDSFGHGILDGVSVVMFHEQAETITDPTGTGWTSPDNDNPEVGDACEEPTMASNRQNVPFGPYYGAVQPLYSDFLGGVCVYDQGGEGVTTLHVGDTANASKWSIQSNLQLGNPIFSDRTYTYKSIPSSLLGGSWIQPAAASKSSTVNPLVTFRVGQSTTVEVAVDTRLGRRSWMDSSWVDTSSQIIDSESTPTHFEVFKKSFSAGPVQLGPNAGSGSA